MPPTVNEAGTTVPPPQCLVFVARVKCIIIMAYFTFGVELKKLWNLFYKHYPERQNILTPT